MISDFELLTQKVGELAELAHALRRENADLRAYSSALVAENGELSRRMTAAHERVAALLERLPDAPAESSLSPALSASIYRGADIASAQQEPA